MARQDVRAQCVVHKEIDTFTAPEFPPDLVSLRLYNCVIRDLESIRSFKHLQELHMRDCGLRDISPLGRLTKLTHLSLADNEIMNIAPLSRCEALTWLDLRHNRIADVSPLKVLDRLVRLDIRSNPLGDGLGGNDIRIITEKNPTAKVLLGPDSNDIRGDLLRPSLAAKARIANFALGAEWHYHDGFPNLPLVSEEIDMAFLMLREVHDQEYISDVSIALMRYAIHILATTHTGTLLSRENPHPLLSEFLRFVPRHELAGDEITTGAIAYWVCNHRNQIPSSAVLDAYVHKYEQLEIALEEESKAIKR